LRGTVYGNLASLHTGSALHRFPFAQADPVMASGWIEVRLTTYDAAGRSVSDTTAVRIGEVATGQTRTEIISPDGAARLVLPPLALPAGIGTLSIDRDDVPLPAGAPSPASAAYDVAPAGLAMAAPMQVAIRTPDGASLVVLS